MFCLTSKIRGCASNVCGAWAGNIRDTGAGASDMLACCMHNVADVMGVLPGMRLLRPSQLFTRRTGYRCGKSQRHLRKLLHISVHLTYRQGKPGYKVHQATCCSVFGLAAGFCQAALHAWGLLTDHNRKAVFSMLIVFLKALSPHLLPAAQAELVAENAVELTVRTMVEADTSDQSYTAVYFLVSLDPLAREKMCAPGVVGQQIKWAAKWLLKVRKAFIM
jgi:hypothetical protein